MINKRLLIKNIISHNDEGTFFDKKQSINLTSTPEKAKFLKHICALSNSNPNNDSYIIVGISDENRILGVPSMDDSVIQNLVKSFLLNPPIVSYENIQIPESEKYQTVGLLTIFGKKDITSFSKNIWKISKGDSFYRYGSNSIHVDEKFYVNENNETIIDSIKRFSTNNLKGLIDGVQDFQTLSNPKYYPEYLVFLDQFVLCWSAWRDSYGERKYYSEIDIQIINENKKIFISATQFADIIIEDSCFKIVELVPFGYDTNYVLYPLEETCINFHVNGTYSIEKKIVFRPPIFPQEEIENLYARTKELTQKYLEGVYPKEEMNFQEGIAQYYLACYLNGIESAKDDLYKSREYLDGSAAEWQAQCMRILEKYEKL